MSFKDNIFSALGVTDLTPCEYRLTLVGRNGIYVEGVKKLLDVTPCRIVMDLKCRILTLNGCCLTVTSLINGDLSVSGEICSIEFKDKVL